MAIPATSVINTSFRMRSRPPGSRWSSHIETHRSKHDRHLPHGDNSDASSHSCFESPDRRNVSNHGRQPTPDHQMDSTANDPNKAIGRLGVHWDKDTGSVRDRTELRASSFRRRAPVTHVTSAERRGAAECAVSIKRNVRVQLLDEPI